MSAHDELRDGIGEAFDALSGEFHPDSTVTLIKMSAPYPEYDVVLVIASKRFFEYADNRASVLLEIADTSATLTDAMKVATHLKIDDDVYLIADSSKTPPKSTDVTWVIEAGIVDRPKYSRVQI